MSLNHVSDIERARSHLCNVNLTQFPSERSSICKAMRYQNPRDDGDHVELIFIVWFNKFFRNRLSLKNRN